MLALRERHAVQGLEWLFVFGAALAASWLFDYKYLSSLEAAGVSVAFFSLVYFVEGLLPVKWWIALILLGVALALFRMNVSTSDGSLGDILELASYAMFAGAVGYVLRVALNIVEKHG